jgi:putative sigma-54 modulation protein
MIRLDITGRNFEVEAKLREYVQDKLGGLDKYLPKHDRSEAYAAVVLCDDPSGREDNRYVCEARMTVRGETIMSREGTVNMYAAIDIVEAKVKAQLVKYKQKRTIRWRRNRMLYRLIGRRSETDTQEREAKERAQSGDSQASGQEVI